MNQNMCYDLSKIHILAFLERNGGQRDESNLAEKSDMDAKP